MVYRAFFSISLLTAVVFSLSGCSGTESTSSSQSREVATDQTSDETTEKVEKAIDSALSVPAPGSGGKAKEEQESATDHVEAAKSELSEIDVPIEARKRGTSPQTDVGHDVKPDTRESRGGFLDRVTAQVKSAAGDLGSATGNESESGALSVLLDRDEIIGGLKEALAVGTEKAISYLGQEDGFFANTEVRVPLPQDLKYLRNAMRLIGREKDVDTFVLTMNRAAEAAVPQAGAIFANALREMTVSDAQDILKGNSDEATQFFKRTTSGSLTELILPVVRTTTEATGVTSQYKAITSKLKMIGKFSESQAMELDVFITEKALDGLFYMIGKEEEEIRANPAARTTDLLKRVFGEGGSG